MDFAQGQVSKIDKITEYIKNIKDRKLSSEQTRLTKEIFFGTKAEIDTLRAGLNNLTEKEAIEASIYRLKAAEIDLNRHIKATKSEFSKAE